jgi:hypothetical protein
MRNLNTFASVSRKSDEDLCTSIYIAILKRQPAGGSFGRSDIRCSLINSDQGDHRITHSACYGKPVVSAAEKMKKSERGISRNARNSAPFTTY